jgi:RimJ/RimL family protein N-acetyltransferase
MNLSSVSLTSQRLLLMPFTSDDALEAIEAATPTLTRFMGWDPAPSLEVFSQIWRSWFPMMLAGTDLHLVVREKLTLEFLGMAGLHNISADEPEAGIWVKESRHGYGYGREAVAAVISLAARDLGKRAVLYPVVEQNSASRRLAERLGGSIVGTRVLRKAGGVEYPEVVYSIPALAMD